MFIYSGAGGTDAQDWTEMLERMYLGWASSRGFSVTTTQRMPGRGLHSSTVRLNLSTFCGISCVHDFPPVY